MKSSLRSNGLFLAIIGIILFLYLVYQRPIEGFQGTSGNSVAIITANFGNYDSLKDPNVNNANMVDWYCFTDNTDTKSEIWNVIDTPYHLQNEREYYSEYKNSYRNITDPKIRNMMAAKYYKIKAHEIQYVSKRWMAVLRTCNQMDGSESHESRFLFDGSANSTAQGRKQPSGVLRKSCRRSGSLHKRPLS